MQKQSHTALRIALTILSVLILGTALVYFTGVVYFQSHFPFRTTFLGYDISQRDVSAIDECMQTETDARVLTILEQNGAVETMELSSSAGYHRTAEELDGGWLHPGDAWRWPASLWTSNDLTGEIAITYSPELLEEAMFSLDAMNPANIQAPRNAYLEWQDGVCVMVPEEDGNELYAYRVLRALRTAIENDEDRVDLAAENCYRRATVRSDDPGLNTTLSRYEAINFQQVEIDMTGETVTLSPSDVLSFYTVDHGGRLELSREAVAAYAERLKDQYDTYERQRPFVNRYGKEITVGTRADTYGFKMDLDATVALLTETLESKERLAQIQPVWTNEASAREENGSDIGDTYIEVSIGEQYLWAYIDGELVLSTSVVTGNTGNHDTPRGVFRILNMQRNATLVGEDYETPVSYWMPITWSGVGLHDATWRSSFGGSIYTYNGSHGCVNLPYWAAKDLYWSFYEGTPVVIW